MAGAAATSLAVERSDETLRSRVQSRLRDAILDGYFAPGQKLNERELTELTGVSRSIVREAMVHLEARGLIERVAFKGFVVARLGPDKVREIYELRSSLEALTAELFTKRASDASLVELRQAGDSLQEALRKGELARIREATTRYYDIMLDGCGNSEIRRALQAVADRILHLRSQSIADPKRRGVSAAEMQALTDALCRRDADAAVRITRQHVDAARDAILARLGAQGESRRSTADGENRGA